ncbi:MULTISPECIES: ABC transporter ATP-binding protein [Dictyoglomus]|uniref:ABC transporter related n=1 Tax=Dictyoglomus turgidum (strain DSM 6724 / Z-1310) TaxID=515635 RepID=B8E189_DICTD|nr:MULTISPECIES: ABC transporter ATP-binding protein [Dictyoglomus]ACK42217.1 ABC transporter related [Dictyoglomus turgidum DSM 6724]PNV79850.1 MAG: ABC transporter ATP-binding protein [Dictyoglomus turgidum]HBU32447.1 ABC transporter ATP-binding protein [Dictyoglomus sp.]
MLSIRDLHVYYGGIKALQGINIDVNEGEVVALVGANGAGKTTTLRSIFRLTPIVKGDIFFYEINLTKVPTHRVASLGIAHVPEGRRVFPNMTVRENLEMGAFLIKDKNIIKNNLDFVYSLFPRLKEREKQLAGTLSGGEQQMLAIGRALMSNARLLLLDEPSMGLAPLLVQEIFSVLKKINEEKRTLLLVEQNANMAFSIAHRVYVMETGKIVLSGTTQEVANNEAVKKAYLGG